MQENRGCKQFELSLCYRSYSRARAHPQCVCVHMHSSLSPPPLFGLLNHSRSYLRVNKHYHVLNETQVRKRAQITIHYHTLTESGVSSGSSLWLVCICMEIQLRRCGPHVLAHMEICKHTPLHSINPPAVPGPPAKRAVCLLIIYTAHIILLPISLQ